MAARKLTLQQQQKLRDEAKANAKAAAKSKAKSGDRIDEIVAQINGEMGGDGYVMRGTQVRQQMGKRVPTGNPALDYILCGGPPEGTLLEIGGPYSSGKTTSAIHILVTAQQTEWAKPFEQRRAQAWVAIEPFSKTWARENGYWIPFCEEEILDPDTGEMLPMDPWSAATAAEIRTYESLGLESPYSEITPFVLITSQIGDKALDASISLLESNRFTHIVVDSLGVVKSTKWVTEKDTQSAGDFSREPKMISDYTTRALVTLNCRYDDNGEPAKDGNNRNRTVIVHLNQIITNIGTDAHAAHKVFGIKGGEGNKHNHHAIVFMHRVKPLEVPLPGGKKLTYGQLVRAICIKSKIGAPFREAEYELYFEDYGHKLKGKLGVSKSLAELGVMLGIIEQSGAWLAFGDFKGNGWDGFARDLDKPENEPTRTLLAAAIQRASLPR